MIKLKALLKEARSTPVIIVDIQPSYDKWCGHLMPRLCEFLNNQTGKVLILFNGEDLDLDSKEQVIEYYLDYGLEESKIPQIQWKEKMYGYFRDLMDSNVEPRVIIKVIREMVLKRIGDSRELSQEFIQRLIEEEGVDLEQMPVFLPDIAISLLREYNSGYIAGGGRHECFREIQLFMNALNIKYKEMKAFIY